MMIENKSPAHRTHRCMRKLMFAAHTCSCDCIIYHTMSKLLSNFSNEHHAYTVVYLRTWKCTYKYGCIYEHVLFHRQKMYSQQFCNPGSGYCDVQARDFGYNDPGNACTQGSECRDDGQAKSKKLPCCNTYGNYVKVRCLCIFVRLQKVLNSDFKHGCSTS
jgi:hypothetical protein